MYFFINSKAQKDAYDALRMKILTLRKILKICPVGVEYKPAV